MPGNPQTPSLFTPSLDFLVPLTQLPDANKEEDHQVTNQLKKQKLWHLPLENPLVCEQLRTHRLLQP